MNPTLPEGSDGLERQNFVLEGEGGHTGHCELRDISDNMEEVDF